MSNWGDVFVSVYDPSDLVNPKFVSDNGRTVYYTYPLEAEGDQEANDEGFGRVKLYIRDRDAWPLIDWLDHVHVYQHSQLAGGNLTICRFIVKKVTPNVNANGGTIEISGPGILDELNTRVITQAVIDDGNDAPATNSFTQALGYAPHTWSSSDASTPNGDYLTIAKHTILDAIKDMSALAGLNIRYQHPRTVKLITNTEVSSGLSVVQVTSANKATVESNVNYGPIISIQRNRDRSEFFTRAYIEGAKVGDDPLGIHDMDYSGISVPAGFTVYWSSNLIVNTAVETAQGVRIERYLEYPEIKPAEDTAEAKQTAQESLFWAAIEGITAAASKEFDLEIETVINREVNVGEKVYIYYEEEVNSETTFGVDGSYYLHRISHKTSTENVRYTSMTLSTYPIPVGETNGATAVAKSIKNIKKAVNSLTASPVGGSATQGDHGQLSGLEDDDHPQYLLADGSRQLAGNLAVAAGITIDGVDIGAHAADPAAHHAPMTVASSTPTGALTVNNQALSFVIGAGSGLAYSGTTMNINAGEGLVVNSDQLDINLAGDSGLQIVSDYLSMGNPQTVTLISFNNKNLGEHSHAADWTADTSSKFGLLGSTDGLLRLHGLGVNTAAVNAQFRLNGNIELLNASSNIHFQTDLRIYGGDDLTMDPTGDITLNPAALLQITGAGNWRSSRDLYFTAAANIGTLAGDLALAPTSNLILKPSSEVVEVGDGVLTPIMRTDTWTSGFLGNGWGLSHDGHLDVRSIYTEELRATFFTAEHQRVLNGGEWITPSVSQLAAAFTVPAVGNSGTLIVEDVPGFDGVPVFGEDDYVLMRGVDRTGGGLTFYLCWGQVSGYTDLTNNRQSYTFITRQSLVTGQSLAIGTTVVDFGQSGDGGIFLNAVDLAGSPYIDMYRWYNNPYTASNRIHPIRLGDLGGTGVTKKGDMGLFVGDSAGRYFVISESKFESHGMAFSLYDDGGSGGYIKLCAAEVAVYGGGYSETNDPNADISDENVQRSSGSINYVLIDDDPDAPNTSDWVANIEGKNAELIVDLLGMGVDYVTTETILIKAYCVKSAGIEANIRLVADIITSAGEPISSLIELMNTSQADGLKAKFARPLRAISNAEWDAARLRFRWFFQPSGAATEYIRLDPNYPYIAVGNGPSTMSYSTGGTGFWAGLDSGTIKMRVGGSVGPALRWNGTSVLLDNSDGNAVIVLEGATGNSYFNGIMTIASSGEIRQGTGTWGSDFSGIRMWNSSGIGSFGTYKSGVLRFSMNDDGATVFVKTNNSYKDTPSAYTFNSGSNEIAGLYAQYRTTPTTRVSLGIETNSLMNCDQELFLRAQAPPTKVAYAHFEALSETYGGGRGIHIIDGGYAADGIFIQSDYISLGYGTTYFAGGISLHSNQDPKDAQFIIDQQSTDYETLIINSSDVAHGISTGYDISTNTYTAISKYTSTAGGLQLKGLSEGTTGMCLRSYGLSTDTSTGTSSRGSIRIDTFVGTTPGALSATSNMIAITNNGTCNWILKGNGDVHINGSQSTYDSYNDVDLIRRLELEVAPDAVIRSEFDKFLVHNRSDLIAANILSEEGFINTTQLQRLQNGAIWQLWQRLAKLEQLVNSQ